MMRAMILAAGRGVRMGALTENRPKPLLKLGRETLIEHHVRRLVAAGLVDIVINLSYRGEQVRQLLGEGARLGAQIAYSEEGYPPLETGGGIINALPLLGDEPFIVVNADVVSDYALARLAESPLAPGLLGRLVLVPNPVYHARGDFGVDVDGHVTLRRPFMTFAGISVLDPGLFRDCMPGRQPLKPILDRAIGDGAIVADVHRGGWIDAGTPERLAEANAQLARNA
jgi:MurNAc alpha-1-phosphate uridylyltransferase